MSRIKAIPLFKPFVKLTYKNTVLELFVQSNYLKKKIIVRKLRSVAYETSVEDYVESMENKHTKEKTK